MVRKRRERDLTASLPECFHNGIILIVICFGLFLRYKITTKKLIMQIIHA